MWVHVYAYATHTHTKINLLNFLTASIYIGFSIYFSCIKQENKNINHINKRSPCLQGNYPTYECWNGKTLSRELCPCTHTYTHPHIMKIWGVLSFTHEPIYTIRTDVGNFINQIDGRRERKMLHQAENGKSEKQQCTFSPSPRKSVNNPMAFERPQQCCAFTVIIRWPIRLEMWHPIRNIIVNE